MIRTHFAPQSSGRLDELDSLRGLAAMSVVLNHFKIIWYEDATRGLPHLTKGALSCLLQPFTAGHEAVILFFILSGFVLSIPAINSRAQTYPVFVVRRIFRIYFPYLVALTLAVLGFMIRHGHVTQGQWFNQFWFGSVNWHLVMQHVIFLGQYNTEQFDPPVWSLVYEMRISLVFPLLCAIALRLKPTQSLIMAACMSCLSILTMKLLPPPHFYLGTVSTLHYAALFIVGIYLARQRSIISNILTHLSRRKQAAIAILSVLLYFYAAFGISHRLTQYGLGLSSDWFTALGAAGLIVFSLNSASWRRVLLWPPIHALGKMSYSVYLLHFIIMQLLIELLWGKIPVLFVIPLCLVAVVAASWAFYCLVELPFMNLGRRLGGYLTPRKT